MQLLPPLSALVLATAVSSTVAQDANRGAQLYLRLADGVQSCVGCHGPEATGMHAVGAPNLTDKVWLYGSSEATITETITKGRQNQMPAWKEFLGDAKVHLLSAYVLSVSQGAK